MLPGQYNRVHLSLLKSRERFKEDETKGLLIVCKIIQAWTENKIAREM